MADPTFFYVDWSVPFDDMKDWQVAAIFGGGFVAAMLAFITVLLVGISTPFTRDSEPHLNLELSKLVLTRVGPGAGIVKRAKPSAARPLAHSLARPLPRSFSG